MFTKSLAIVLRESDRKILVYSFESEGYDRWRMPGGGVEEGELIEESLLRELWEEAGVKAITIGRKLGVLRYVSTMDGQPRERHCFLAHPMEPLPERWEHVVSGDGDDADMVFTFFWAGVADFGRIDPTLAPILSLGHLPELYQ